MKPLPILILTLFIKNLPGQVKTGVYENKCSQLKLYSKSFYYTRPVTKYISHAVSGTYKVNGDTLILSDTLSSEYKVVCHTYFYIQKEPMLTYVREYFENGDNKDYLKHLGHPPTGLQNCGDYTLVRIIRMKKDGE